LALSTIFELPDGKSTSSGLTVNEKWQIKVSNFITNNGEQDEELPAWGPPIDPNLFNRVGDNSAAYIMTPLDNGNIGQVDEARLGETNLQDPRYAEHNSGFG
jgi:hypothetical protein